MIASSSSRGAHALSASVIAVSLFGPPGSDPRAQEPLDPFEGLDLEARVAAVNEGDLHFLDKPPDSAFHHHLNEIEIIPGSLADGWVTLRQCHENIDPVPAAQVLYRADGIRDLEIASTLNIGKAWVQGHTVQLEDVKAQARLCVTGESQAFQALGNGVYRLRNGPFMRRFLDGFYPLRVKMNIAYPADILVPAGNAPEEQTGFAVERREGSISVDALFEGRLQTCFLFCDRRLGSCPGAPADCAETSKL
jgi:hypothetical protein